MDYLWVVPKIDPYLKFKEASLTWLIIWKYRKGPWSIICKNVAQIIAKEIWRSPLELPGYYVIRINGRDHVLHDLKWVSHEYGWKGHGWKTFNRICSCGSCYRPLLRNTCICNKI